MKWMEKIEENKENKHKIIQNQCFKSKEEEEEEL